MFGVVLLTLSAFGLLVHSHNTQAIGEERENIRATPFAEGQIVGKHPVYNSIPPENQPPEERWIPLATDPAEHGGGLWDLKAIYGQVHNGIFWLKGKHWGNWHYKQNIEDHIYLDADQNANTGYPIRGIGADYKIYLWVLGEPMVVIRHAGEWRWDGDLFTYLDTPDSTNTWVLGIHLCHFCPEISIYDAVEHVGAFDIVVQNEITEDLIPDTGHITLEECFCADPNADGVADIVDVVYLIRYVLKSGPAPNCR